jgi:alpha-beta hydrolase superfamily lysophospholipase
MAHGFAAEKTFGLAAYAERFAAEGIAVYVFDYRCFGDSDGQPRNLVSPSRHLQD